MTADELMQNTLLFLRDRSSAYKTVFKENEVAQHIVLEDLARFCRANETCAVPGDRDRSLILEGRREVWLRIQQHLGLTEKELMAIYNRKTIAPPQ